jgi:type I restriction enzyme R subunit
VSAIADRLARLDLRLTGADRLTIEELTDGMSLQEITGGLFAALDPDRQLDEARSITGADYPAESDIVEAAHALIDGAALPLASNPLLRTTIIELRRSYEQLIDEASTDVVLSAGYSTEQARRTVDDFRQFIEDHKDEITALQILYSHPYQRRVTFRDIRDLANAIGRPPHQWTPEGLWAAHQALDKSAVHGSGQRTLTDLVSLVRYALGEDGELVPYPQKVNERFAAWLLQQELAGADFSEEQLRWLEEIRDHVAASMGITTADLDYTPFVERGGIGKAYEVFGDRLSPLLEELTDVLAA